MSGERLMYLTGAGLVMATAVASVPPANAGPAGAANNALRQLGAALGPALLGAGASWTSAQHACAAALAGALPRTTLVLLPTHKRAGPTVASPLHSPTHQGELP